MIGYFETTPMELEEVGADRRRHPLGRCSVMSRWPIARAGHRGCIHPGGDLLPGTNFVFGIVLAWARRRANPARCSLQHDFLRPAELGEPARGGGADCDAAGAVADGFFAQRPDRRWA